MPYVNGHPVPPLIPATHVLVYFPQGILGLQKVYVSTPMLAHANGDLALDESAHEAVFLESDGSLRLDQDGEYFLPNFVPGGCGGGTAGAEETAAAVVDSAVGRVEHHVTRLLVEEHPGDRVRRAVEDGGAAVANQRPRQSAVRFEERHPESQGHTPPPGRSDAGSDAPSDASHGGDGRMGDENADRLTKSVLFDRAADLVPDEADEDEAALFQSQRRCSLVLYLASHVVIVGAWTAAIILDDVLRCPCGRFGLWTSCSVCGLNTTLREPPPSTQIFELDSCFSTSNFAECDAPNFSNIRNMLIASTGLYASNAIIVLVDLTCGITPRRPFYPFYFLVLWSMGLATWVILGVAATSPASYNLSQLECEMQSNVANSYFTEHNVLLYHPLERTRWSTERMDEVSIVGFGIRSYGADCEFSWTVGLTSMAWIIYTIIGMFYFYSRYSAWNELTARRVAKRDAPADGKTDGRCHNRTSSFTESGRAIAAERARRKKQHQRTNSGSNRPTGSEQSGGTYAATSSDGLGELGRGFGEGMHSSSKNLDRAATAPPQDPLSAAAARDQNDEHGSDDAIELDDVAHVRSWVAGEDDDDGAARARPPRPIVPRAGSKGPETPRSKRRGRLISPARDEL